MECFIHKEREARAACCGCGKMICEECGIEIGGRVYCKDCVVDLVKGQPDVRPNRSSSMHPATSPAVRPTPRGDFYHAPRPRFYSGFLTFICAMLPGAGHMYLGLMRRGIFIMGAFFLSSYLLSVFDHSPVAAFAIVVTIVASFFDAFRIRRLLNSGDSVEDSFDDIVGLIRKYILLIGGLFVFDIALNVLRDIGDMHGLESIMGLLIIAAGIYFVLSTKKSKRHDKREAAYPEQDGFSGNDFIDKR